MFFMFQHASLLSESVNGGQKGFTTLHFKLNLSINYNIFQASEQTMLIAFISRQIFAFTIVEKKLLF
jgi:hypothetical protein